MTLLSFYLFQLQEIRNHRDCVKGSQSIAQEGKCPSGQPYTTDPAEGTQQKFTSCLISTGKKILNSGNQHEQSNLVDQYGRIKMRARGGKSLMELRYLWLIISYKDNSRKNMVTSSSINHDIIHLSLSHTPPASARPPLHISQLTFLIPSANSPSISHTFFLYVSRDVAQAKD